MKNNMMPYRLEDGEMERIKASCIQSIRDAAERRHRIPALRIVEFAAAAVCVIAVTFIGIKTLKPVSPLESFLSELRQAPSDVIDEMSSDIADYNEDYSNLL